MAPVIKPAAPRSAHDPTSSFQQFSSRNAEISAKRKVGDDALVDNGGDLSDSGNEDGTSSKKLGEGVVSKRTLQNRKAQREFRKRREARVRELEERCRRFDQMGLEANAELQRIARTLKEENDALRGFMMRMGLGNVLTNALQSVGEQQVANNNSTGGDQLFQPTFSGLYGGSSFSSEPTFFMNNDAADGENDGSANASIAATRNRDSFNGVHGHLNNNDSKPSQLTNSTLAPTPASTMQTGLTHQGENEGDDIRRGKHSSSSPISARSTHSNEQEAPLLTLRMPNKSQGPHDTAQQQQQQPPSAWSSANDQALNAMLGNSTGSGVGGTAMLGSNGLSGSNGGPFPVPQRNYQSSALLNPNPIPFSFNLSNGGDAASQATWWDQVGGALEPIELDDKAQAVANAQQGAQQAQSPFDLSAFLQGGITPGGGFQLGNFGSGQGDVPQQSTPYSTLFDNNMNNGYGSSSSSNSHSNKASGSGSDTEHMRMFIQLMERKMAERDARRYASLGFQPPSQDPAQRVKLENVDDDADRRPKVSRAASELTPSGVYSRLAQHPEFLSTSVRELEELVDALGQGTYNGQRKSLQRGSDRLAEDGYSDNVNTGAMKHRNRTASPRLGAGAMQSTLSGSGRSPNSVGLHVDEGTIGKLLGLLDRKRDAQTFKGLSNAGEDGQLSIAMT